MAVSYLSLTKKLQDLPSNPDLKTLKVAVGGNCNTDFLAPGLQVRLADFKIQSEIIKLDYDSWLQAVQQNNVQADFWVIWLSSLGATHGGTDAYNFDYNNIAQAIHKLTQSKTKIIVILPERMQISKDFYAPLYKDYLQAKNTLLQMLPSEVLLVDPETIHSALGDAAWYAARYWSLSKLPCHPNAAAELSLYTGNLIAKCIKPEIKAIVVDLDNTLWGGIVGEDGVDNLLIDVNTEGRAYLQMQYLLKTMLQQGIPLCVVSKNNLQDAQAPFLQREEMLLKLDDFVYFIANWQAKSSNIQEIANKLKLNVDAICFIDDSVYERTEVKTAIPNLIVPELPNDPDARVAMLIDSGMFVIPTLSNEDRERAAYYKADVQREEFLATTLDVNQYLAGLQMCLEPVAIDANNMQRVVSLINRTNQFNLTNKRHTAQDVAHLLTLPNTYAYCYRLQDKFGDSGIIGALIAIQDNDAMYIDTFLMSCRVLNRKVEAAIFDHFIKWAQNKGFANITAEYIKSAKNVLVEDLYAKFGLTVIQATQTKTSYTSNKLTAIPHPITIST